MDVIAYPDLVHSLSFINLHLCPPKPIRSFYFWVDVIATLSILIDIPAIMDPIINGVR